MAILNSRVEKISEYLLLIKCVHVCIQIQCVCTCILVFIAYTRTNKGHFGPSLFGYMTLLSNFLLFFLCS